MYCFGAHPVAPSYPNLPHNHTRGTPVQLRPAMGAGLAVSMYAPVSPEWHFIGGDQASGSAWRLSRLRATDPDGFGRCERGRLPVAGAESGPTRDWPRVVVGLLLIPAPELVARPSLAAPCSGVFSDQPLASGSTPAVKRTTSADVPLHMAAMCIGWLPVSISAPRAIWRAAERVGCIPNRVYGTKRPHPLSLVPAGLPTRTCRQGGKAPQWPF